MTERQEKAVTPVWIVNARIVAQAGLIERGAVQVVDGRVTAVHSGDPPDTNGAPVLDATQRLLIPGMIDVHIHGAGGFDMMDGTRESIQEVSRVCAQTGCTSFLATSVSSTSEELLRFIDQVRNVAGHESGAAIAGIHAEGPYLNEKRRGMQNPLALRHPSLSEMQQVLDHAGSLLKMVTLAPELPSGLELTSYLKERGVVVAIAHSDATYEQALEAFRRGASHITHCFNGMRPIHHRDPGLIVAALEQPFVSVQAIVDHVHLHPAIVRLLYRLKGPGGMVLITDALQAMNLGDGEFVFGGQNVHVQGGVARLSDGTLASSTVTMNQALRNSVELGIPLVDAVAMAATTPADILGLPRKGRIAVGADADLVLLDHHWRVSWTMIGGRWAYRTAEPSP